MTVKQFLKSTLMDYAPRPVQDRMRSAYHLLNRRVLHANQYQPVPDVRREQFSQFASALTRNGHATVCVIGESPVSDLPNQVKVVHANFDIGSRANIVDLLANEKIDGFFLNSASTRDLVNLTNLMTAYDLESTVLMGTQLACHSLIAYVPIMPPQRASTSISVHNYFARNYKITDALLCQGYLYRGANLAACHQFLLKPEETKVIDLGHELNLDTDEAGTYFLEVFHPQLPTSTPEFRYFGIYKDEGSGFMAGTHSIALGQWNSYLTQRQTATRTFVPVLDGVTVNYIVPGHTADFPSPDHSVETELGNKIAFSTSRQRGSFEGITAWPTSADQGSTLEFDRISSGLPIFGGNGFQTLWGERSGLAVWHDGNSVRGLGNRASGTTIKGKNSGDNKSIRPVADKSAEGSIIMFEERQESTVISDDLLDLYQSRAKYFVAAFPFLGHDHPDLHVVFDHEQWQADINNFEIALYSNSGTLLETKPLKFNGSLQTVNLNQLFTDCLAELAEGYWVITADPRDQGDALDLDDLQWPSGSMLFGFWSDGTTLYDSVHSLDARNSVGFDMGLKGVSDAARATARIVSRTKKFAPLEVSGGRTSWYWLCNVGRSEESIDANIRVRVLGPGNEEGVTSLTLPARSARIITAEEVLKQCGVNFTQGTLWIEAHECNVGGIWFQQFVEGKGFATDHFTGA